MGAKKKVLLYIDSVTIQKAKDLGLNLSKVSENALKEAIRRLEGPRTETNCPDGSHCAKNGSWCGGWDLNPMIDGCVAIISRNSPLFSVLDGFAFSMF